MQNINHNRFGASNENAFVKFHKSVDNILQHRYNVTVLAINGRGLKGDYSMNYSELASELLNGMKSLHKIN